MEHESIKERLRTFLKWKGESNAAFSSKIGVSESYIAAMRKAPAPDKISAIQANYPELSIAWLITGEGEMINGATKDQYDPATDEEKKSCEYVPMLNLDSVGGLYSSNAEYGPGYIERYIPVPDAMKGDIILPQSGNSMSPAIPPGALLQIREVTGWREYIGYGDVFVLMLNDKRRITKEIRRYEPDPQNYFWCVSYNPDVADEELPKSYVERVWKVIRVMIDKGW